VTCQQRDVKVLSNLLTTCHLEIIFAHYTWHRLVTGAATQTPGLPAVRGDRTRQHSECRFVRQLTNHVEAAATRRAKLSPLPSSCTMRAGASYLRGPTGE